MFKPFKDEESFLVSIKKNWGVLVWVFFVGDVTKGVGLDFYLAHIHQALGPNPKSNFLFHFQNKN